MSKVLGLIGAAFLFAGPSFAADMAFKAPVMPLAPAFSWTGFYVGGDIGGFEARQSGTTNPFPSPGFGAPAILGAGVPGFGNLPTSHDLGGIGVLGGFHAGYNLQFANWLLGVEGDYTFLNRNVSNTQTVLQTFTTPAAPAFSMQLTASNHFLASARGRLGVTWDKWLFYATGGAAWTDTSYSATASGLVGGRVNLAGVGASTTFSDSKLGFVVGAGAEWMITPNWLLRAEFLHYDFEGSSAVLPLVFANGPAGSSCPAGACNWAVSTSRLQFETVRAGLSYKF